MNCGTCTHWELKGSPMRIHGMGTCAKEVGIFRRARTFGPDAPCGKNQFAKATDAVIKARTAALARQGKAG